MLHPPLYLKRTNEGKNKISQKKSLGYSVDPADFHVGLNLTKSIHSQK
jgi:hypothetical protein